MKLEDWEKDVDMSCLPKMCMGIEIITMYSSMCEVCDQDLEQVLFHFITANTIKMLIRIQDSISSVDSFCPKTPFALANLGIFWQSEGVLYIFSLM